MRHRVLVCPILLVGACFGPPSAGTSTGPNTFGTVTDTATDSATTSPAESSGDVSATGVGTGSGDETTGGSGDETTAGSGDETGDTTGGDCEAGCDDGIPCTEDSCVDGACVNTPMDIECDDGVPCTVDACNPALGCTLTPDDALCDDGVGCTADVCDPMLGCGSAPDDALCDDGLACTSDSCDPVLDCQYDATVLVYNGANGMATTPEDAVTGLGFTPIVVTDEAGFNAAFDAGGFGAILVDIATGVEFSTIPTGMRTRIDTFISGDGRVIFGFWNLDGDAPMQGTLDVGVTASLNSPPPIHPDPASPVNLFALSETIIAPITYPDFWADNGDQLSLAGPGFIAGRFDSAAAGAPAIVVTHGDRVITNGFAALEIGQGMTDADLDGINDGEELLRNEIEFVCSAP